MFRSSSPGRRMFWWLPVTKSTARTSRGAAPRGHRVKTASRATVSETIGLAGSDIQTLPPTVAAFQILNEARSARQHSRRRGPAFQSPGALKRSSSAIVQVAATSSPFAEALRAGHSSEARSISVSVLTWGSE